MSNNEEEFVSDVVIEDWYENDLQLAAELGKTLLERNNDLERKLREAHSREGELRKDVQLMNQKLEMLKEVCESRMRLYEEVDKNVQELEKANKLLKKEAKVNNEKIESIMMQLESSELKNSELLERIENLHKQKADSKKNVPDLQLRIEEDNQRIEQLEESVRLLKVKKHSEEMRKGEMKNELDGLLTDKEMLESKVTNLSKELSKIDNLEHQISKMEVHGGRLCKLCAGKLHFVDSNDTFEKAAEHDDPSGVSVTHGKLIRLKNGGSAYGSRESLNKLGLESEEEIVPLHLETCSQLHFTPCSNSSAAPESPGASILGELEEQYRSLVCKYELLVKAKEKHAGQNSSPPSSTGNQQSLLLEEGNPVDCHFNKGPPEYKKLFQEIFDTLRRSIDEPKPSRTNNSE